MSYEEELLLKFLNTGILVGSITMRATIALALERYDLLPASWQRDPLAVYIDGLDRWQQLIVARYRGWPIELAVQLGGAPAPSV